MFLQTQTAAIGRNKFRDLSWPMAVVACENKWNKSRDLSWPMAVVACENKWR